MRAKIGDNFLVTGDARLIRVGYDYVFFFSSRRRHTRCLSDWSSDVCSSDLTFTDVNAFIGELDKRGELARITEPVDPYLEVAAVIDRVSKSPGGGPALLFERSEERRVGKEWRSRRWP